MSALRLDWPTLRSRQPARLRRGQAGFTLPEMLVATVLVGGAAVLIGSAAYQIFVVARGGQARLAVLSDLESAALWIGRDASQARSFTPGSGSVYGTLASGDPDLEYRYSYDSAASSLVREVLVSGAPTSSLRIARRIASQGDVAFSVNGSLLTVSLTSTVGATSETATLRLGMRVK